MIFDYMKTDKYKNYKRNQQIFSEKSSGVFQTAVVSRVKLELMGSGAIMQGDSVFSGFQGGSSSYSPISGLIVPNNFLSSVTNAYISYATSGQVLFDTKEIPYMEQKVKDMIREQSIGGSCLIKKVEKKGLPYINIYNAISYYVVRDEYVQDIIKSYVIFNLIEKTDGYEVYLTEDHQDGLIVYRKIKLTTNGENKGDWEYLNTELTGYEIKEDVDGIKYSYETISAPIVTEVSNTCFDGESDYTDDNVACLRELVVTNTINSQTFDKISNPLLALPEESIEYDKNNNARVNLQDRVIIIGGGDGSTKPEQISLESKIEQSQVHKDNLQNQLYSSLAVNKSALGLIDAGQLSGEALRRMLTSTIARVEEKRANVAKAIYGLLGVEVDYSDVITSSQSEIVESVTKAVSGGIMSQKEGAKRIGNEADYAQIKKEEKEAIGSYDGFNEDPEED